MKNLNISIAGLGNVGSAVVNVIEDNSSYLEKKSNLKLNIIGLSAKNINKERSFDTKKYKWVETPIDLLNINNVKPDILIELMGYEKDISYDLVKSALNQAISSKTDKHIKFLNTFSGSPADIIAAYGKGSSVVSYLASEYGRNSFAELIDNFKMSLSNDQAFQLTYGITLDELEIEWKKSLGEEPDSNAEPTVPQHSPLGNQPSDTDSSSRAIGSCQSSGSDTPLDLAAILLVIAPFCMFGRKSH